MTTLREAAQNVVQVWKLYNTAESLRGWMEILAAALAQEQEQEQEQAEPVAWVYVNRDGECEQIEYETPPDDPSITPLYTTPPQRKPLTDEEIYAAIKGIDSLKAVEVARAIERAHGITGPGDSEG